MIYLARHGETRFNVERRMQGALDSELTPLGVRQARAMGATLRDRVDPDGVVLFCSPQGRARATAGIIAETVGTAPPILLDDLREVTLGCWDGRTGAEIIASDPTADRKLRHAEWFFQSPDGDRFEPFRDRAAVALGILRDHPARIKIAVSHGVTTRVMRGLHLGLDRSEMLQHQIPHGRIYALTETAIAEIDCPA